ncbi:MAG TPA: TraR/DksA family transcriptional regulator [Actinomycetota bacterium]|nr:TraR/DksA family transcriptional regulator [Actinomycetota bacterium]
MAEDVRALLETTRDTLRRELAELTAAPRDPMGAVSFGKRVGEGTSQAVERIAQVDAAKKLDAKLRDVERALEKLDEGTYGVCDGCGGPIGAERVEAIPWATLCVRCAAAR